MKIIITVCSPTSGQIFATVFAFIIAACESSIGLAIIQVYFRVRGSIHTDQAVFKVISFHGEIGMFPVD